jgi:hypothetical protein
MRLANVSLRPIADTSRARDSSPMIDFEQVWLPQIVEYARLVSAGQLENEWLGRATATTSVTDPDELHEQIFDDLDADRIWAANHDNSRIPKALIDAIDRFLAALRNVDGSNPQHVVTSAAWANAKEAGEAVVSSAR